MATPAPLMPKATAVWLLDNTALSFDQIAEFCKLHPLEVKAIADGDAAQGIKGMDPIQSGQLTREQITAAEANHDIHLTLAKQNVTVPAPERGGAADEHRAAVLAHHRIPVSRRDISTRGAVRASRRADPGCLTVAGRARPHGRGVPRRVQTLPQASDRRSVPADECACSARAAR